MTDQTKTINTLATIYANGMHESVSTKELYEVGRQCGFTYGGVKNNLMHDCYKAGRGRFDLRGLYSQLISGTAPKSEDVAASSQPKPLPTPTAICHSMPKITAIVNDDIFIPETDPTFVPWGDYKTVRRVIESKLFFPLYISGLSGNGKTMMVEQACAKLKREYVRVQISPETDEDDLIGGFRLINGETVFHKGPVIKAMERGCILLIDELDRGSNKIMCLQGVLEGKPVLVKKIGQVVAPALGFNVIATANTKGRGSDDGRYSAANIIDDAFIERFVATIDQPYPNFRIERNIVSKHMAMYDIADDDFVNKLVNWSSVIRKTYESEGIDELISTRRLCHIVKAFSIFRDRLQAINMCISRFEAETREAFLDLYTKIDAGILKVNDEETTAAAVRRDPLEADAPF
jgi:MoxR-like ATPase